MSLTGKTLHLFNAGKLSRAQFIAWVVVLTVIGFYLRFRCLDCLGFRGDEDLTSLAIKALADTGVPELPSGMIYLRFYPYQWLLALSVKIFGFSEFSLRLPGVIIGSALVPASYWMTRRIVDQRVAMLVAACIAVSYMQIEVARTARMYAPFFLIYWFAAFAIFQAYFQDRERIFSPWVWLLIAFALSLQQLAYSLAVLLLLAIPLRVTVARTASLLIQAGIVGAIFLIVKSVQESFFYRGVHIADGARQQAAAGDGGLLQSILQQISLPGFELFSQVAQALPLVLLVIALIFGALVVWSSRALTGTPIICRVLAYAALIFSLSHQFNLTIVMLALMLISLRSGITSLKYPAWYRIAGSCAVLFVSWLLVTVLLSSQILGGVELAEAGFRKLLRILVDYPNFRLFWSFALEHPLLAIPLMLGTLWGIDRIARRDPNPAALLVVGGFWITLFLNGILETKFEFFRYNLHLDLFFLIIAAVGILEFPAIVTSLGWEWRSAANSDNRNRIAGIAATVLLLVSMNPLAAVLTSSRDYYESGFLFRALELDTYPDFSTPAAVVREEWGPEDRIFVLDPREFWNYIGRVDYWIWSDNYQSQTFHADGQDLDLYLAIPVLHSESELRSAIRSVGAGDAWILYSQTRLTRTRWLSEPIKELLRSLDNNIVYTGRDRETVVIRLRPDHPIRQVSDSVQP